MNKNLWTGRVEPSGSRYFQVVQQWLPSLQMQKSGPKDVVLMGFACDEGVLRNGGRPGAKEGPDAFRSQLAKLPFRVGSQFFDAGNIACANGDLESATTELGQGIGQILSQGRFPLVIGGGHEVAWGTYQGTIDYCRKNNTRLGIINFDAHFDLRELPNGRGNSGTAFTQIALDAGAHREDFRYLCLGIQPLSNHDQLFERATSLGAKWVEAAHLNDPSTSDSVRKFIEGVDAIFLTLCLDVFHQSVAPGVSAPQPLGIFPDQFLRIARAIAQSKKTLVLEIAELCPAHDGHIDGTGSRSMETARLAAACAATLLPDLIRKT
jgi:formiminoglutamase